MKAINLYKRLYFLIIILIGITVFSCKKLIEIPANPSNQLSTARVFADSTNIMSAVAAVYSNFGLADYGAQFGNGAITIYTGLTGDELIPGASTFTGNAFYTNKILPDNGTVNSMWSRAYTNIFQMNICIEGITSTNAISAGLKSKLIGELKVCRALYYFNMVNIWAGVPLVTSTDYNVTQVLPRASVAEIYNFILSDLVDAQKSLTAAYPSDGHARPNLYTVQALLAKVYLYLGQYQSAIIAANSVIDNGGFSLQSLNNVFINGSAEAIWQIPSNSSYSQTVEGSTFIPYNATSLPNYYLSAQLLSAFEPGDLRKTSWLNFSRVNIGGVPATFYYPFKYKQRVAGQAPVEGYSILRLAEIYLIRAESLAQTNKIAEALVDVNKIRSRANLSNVNSTVKEVILNAILHERQVELFCESGNRWFDLKRSNTINSMLNNKVGWIPSAALFPIPVAERQANPALTQNPEY